MASRLVGVMGKKRHGKDTFAARLTSTHAFTRLAFADPIREALKALNPLVAIGADEVGPLVEAGLPNGYFAPGQTVMRLDALLPRVGWDAVKATREGRRLLQDFGVGLRETTSPTLWVDTTFRLADEVDGPVVITDVRFPNEVEAIRARGGLLVWVTNPNVPDSGDTHASETSVTAEDADRVVWNGATIEALHRIADSVVMNS